MLTFVLHIFILFLLNRNFTKHLSKIQLNHNPLVYLLSFFKIFYLSCKVIYSFMLGCIRLDTVPLHSFVVGGYYDKYNLVMTSFFCQKVIRVYL